VSSFHHNGSKGSGYDCCHAGYPGMVKHWYRAMDVWIDQEFDRDSNVTSFNVSTMETFAIVQDPFDRLRSYFEYCSQWVEEELWKEMHSTKAQYEKVREGDLASRIELEYKENFIPHDAQFEYVDDDVDRAIALISGDSPNVTVLINECFEASLLFMERKFGFQNVNRFLCVPRPPTRFGPMFP
jgi:hypothetical protein